MKILPFGLRSFILPLSLPHVRPEFCVYCYAVVNLRLPRNYSPGFFGGTRGIDLAPFSPCFPFGMVGSNGLGPSTSRLSGVCSNQLSYEPMCGGGNRVRTDDPLLAGQVLYQLSYTPVPSQNFCRFCENKCSLFPGSILFIKNE